jgi:hypothetical protein
MNLRSCCLNTIVAVGGVLAGLGCAEPAPCESPAPPPPPKKQMRAQTTYDYTHSIQHQGKSGLSRKFVVALVRFAEDRPVEDIPYGAEPTPKTPPPAEDSTNVQVDVQIGDRNAQPPRKQPLAMNRRAREVLKHELLESDSFILVERERILDILREQNFGQTRYVNPETSPDMGEVMAVQYLIEGSIGPNEDRTLKDTVAPPPSYKDGEPSLMERIFNPTKAAQRRRLMELDGRRRRQTALRNMQRENCIGVYLSLYDVRTSRIAAEAFGIGGNGLEAIQDAVEDLLDECMDIPNPVRIAAVDGDRVYLDLGEEDNIAIGQRLRYVKPGSVVRNAAGQVIGHMDGEGGELEVVQVQRLMSIAKVTRRVSEPVVGARVEALE